MTPAQLTEVLRAAVTAELTSRGLPADPDAVSAAVRLDRPPGLAHADYASNAALQLAAAAGLSPRDLAAGLAARLSDNSSVAEAQVAGPGFVNIQLTAAAAGRVAGHVVGLGAGYGRADTLTGRRINLEFVSANPTGPVTLASVRWAAVGDALARLLRAQGAAVATEYYFNDAGAQIDKFAASLLAAAGHGPPPEDGYKGAY